MTSHWKLNQYICSFGWPLNGLQSVCHKLLFLHLPYQFMVEKCPQRPAMQFIRLWLHWTNHPILKSHLGQEETPKKIIKFLIILINCSSARQARKGYKMVLRHGAHNSESLPFDDFVQNSNQIIKQSIFIKHRSNRKLLSCQTEFLSHDSWCLLLQEQ